MIRIASVGMSARAIVVAIAVATAVAPLSAAAQSTEHPWLDAKLLAAAKAEGPLVVYSSINEQEALPLFKVFESVTGIKVNYVRGTVPSLTSRMMIEFRSKPTVDIMHMTGVEKVPAPMLATVDLPEAKALFDFARDPNRRWFGVSANYNSPSYNPKLVKAAELPKTYEEFAQRKEWRGKVAIDETDRPWLRALFTHYGEQKGMQIARAIAENLHPVLVNGHLALARSNSAGEYALTLSNFTSLTVNVKLSGGSIENFVLDPVTLFYHQVAVSAKAPNPNAARFAANFLLSQAAQTHFAKFGRLPSRPDVAPNPPGLLDALNAKHVVPVQMTADEERRWGKIFDSIFKGR